jgi:hypothetical protein
LASREDKEFLKGLFLLGYAVWRRCYLMQFLFRSQLPVYTGLIVCIFKSTAVRAITAVNTVNAIGVVVAAAAPSAIGTILFVVAVGAGREVTTIRAICSELVRVAE